MKTVKTGNSPEYSYSSCNLKKSVGEGVVVHVFGRMYHSAR